MMSSTPGDGWYPLSHFFHLHGEPVQSQKWRISGVSAQAITLISRPALAACRQRGRDAATQRNWSAIRRCDAGAAHLRVCPAAAGSRRCVTARSTDWQRWIEISDAGGILQQQQAVHVYAASSRCGRARANYDWSSPLLPVPSFDPVARA